MTLIPRISRERRDLAPWYRPPSIFDQMDVLAREMWNGWRPFAADDNLMPQTDVYEQNGDLIVKTELPGIAKEDLEVTLEGDRLTIKAEKKEEVKEEATHHVRERYYGQYYRSFTIPYPVKEDKVEASFDKRVLELRLPKAEEVKARKIEVKAELPEAKAKEPSRKSNKKTG